MSLNGVGGSTHHQTVDSAFLLFVGLTTILSAFAAFLARLPGQLWLTGLVPIAPGLVAAGFLIQKEHAAKRKDLLSSLVDADVDGKWWAISLLLFPALILIATGLYAATSTESLRFGSPHVWAAVAALPLMLANELGWRGFAPSLLMGRKSEFAKSIIVGLGWTVSIVPIYFIPGFFASGVEFYQLGFALIPASTILFWLRANTESLLIPALCGASAIVVSALLPIPPGGSEQSVTFWLVVGFLWVTAVLIVFYYGSDGLDKSIEELPPDELPVEWERIMPKSKTAGKDSSRDAGGKDRWKDISSVGKKVRR